MSNTDRPSQAPPTAAPGPHEPAFADDGAAKLTIAPEATHALPHAATLEVRDACLCLHAQRAARALARRFDRAFRPFGLTNGQFSLLMALNRPGPVPMRPVSQLLAMDRTTLTAALKPLARRGLVTLDADPRDRRGRLMRLTAAGGALLARAYPVWVAEHRALEAHLPAPGAGQLRAGLVALAFAPETA